MAACMAFWCVVVCRVYVGATWWRCEACVKEVGKVGQASLWYGGGRVCRKSGSGSWVGLLGGCTSLRGVPWSTAGGWMGCSGCGLGVHTAWSEVPW